MTSTKQRSNEAKNQGNVLLLALLIMTGIVLAGGTIATLMTGEFRRGKQAEWALTSFYAAESGVEEALWRGRKTNDAPNTWTQQGTVGSAGWKRTLTDRAQSISEPVIVKNETTFFELTNPDAPTRGAGGSILNLSWSGATAVEVQLQELKDGTWANTGPTAATIVGGNQAITISPDKAYRLSVKSIGADAEDVRVSLQTVSGDLVDLPTPLIVNSTGGFVDSRQTLTVAIPTGSYTSPDNPPSKRLDNDIPPSKLCGLGPSDPRPVLSDDVVLITVGGEGLGCDYKTVGDAVAIIPVNLITEKKSYIIEIRDNGVYPGGVVIGGRATDATHTITVRGMAGKTPTIASTSYGDGIILKWQSFVTIDNITFTGNFVGRTGAIYNEGGGKNTIRNSVFTHFNRGSVIEFNGGENVVIENNTFVANPNSNAISFARDKGKNIIRNNIFSNNTTGVLMGHRASGSNIVTDNTFFLDGSTQSAIVVSNWLSLERAQGWTIDRNHYFVDADRGATLGKFTVGAGRTEEIRYHTLETWKAATGFDKNSDTTVDLANPLFPRWKEVKKTVCATGCDFTTIQPAFDAMPVHVPLGWRDLIHDNISYRVEIQDSRTYVGSDRYAPVVNISAITDFDREIFLAPKTGERPTIQQGTYQRGVRVYYTSDVTVQGLHIVGNNRSNFWGGSLWNEGGARIRFIDNIVENNDGPAIVYQGGTEGLVQGNLIRNTTRAVFAYGYSANHIIRNNIFENTGGAPLVLHDNTSGIRIENNVGWNMKRGSISVSAYCQGGVCNHIFRNNIFMNDGADATALSFTEAFMVGSTISDYNNFFLVNGAKMASVAGTTYATLDEWAAANGKDTHSVNQDPLFANVTTQPFDYHLKSIIGRFLNGTWVTDDVQSSSIDAGDPEGSFAGEPDPNGQRVNQGRYGNTAEASQSTESRR